jgi:integrase
VSTGIQARHARSCATRTSSSTRCTCTPTFQAHVWDAKAQRRIRKTFSTRTGAKQWRHDAIVALRSGELSGDRGPLFSEVIDPWLEDLRTGVIRNRSGDIYKPAAVRDYERNLRLRALPVLKHLRFAEVTTKDVQQLVDRLVRDKLEPATIDAALTPLRALYRRAVARGEARMNPTVGIEKPAVRCKEKRVVPHESAEAMIAALDPSERALWATALYAGLRRGELIGLRRQDIDLANGVIRVERGWDMVEDEAVAPKSRQGKRRVPIHTILRDYLDQHLLSSDEDVFGSPRWVSRTNDRARKRWKEHELPVITLHEARHTYASFGIGAGLNAKTLSTYMGHATISITLDLYGHLMPGNEDQAAGLLDAYFAREIDASTVAQTVAHPTIGQQIRA